MQRNAEVSGVVCTVEVQNHLVDGEAKEEEGARRVPARAGFEINDRCKVLVLSCTMHSPKELRLVTVCERPVAVEE